MFVGEALHTFQLYHQNVFDEDIGRVFSQRRVLVDYGI
jgi:hypothetical protein